MALLGPLLHAAELLPPNVDSDLPRHPLEVLALTDPEQVLDQIAQELREATDRGDGGELALLHLAHANACRMVADWNRWRHEYAIGDTLMVVHTTNEDVDRVNTLAQAYRAAADELSDASVKSPDRDYQLHEGDRVMLRSAPYAFDDRSEPRIENGTRGEIVGVDSNQNSVRVMLGVLTAGAT